MLSWAVFDSYSAGTQGSLTANGARQRPIHSLCRSCHALPLIDGLFTGIIDNEARIRIETEGNAQ